MHLDMATDHQVVEAGGVHLLAGAAGTGDGTLPLRPAAAVPRVSWEFINDEGSCF
jgi:hypothetical protein